MASVPPDRPPAHGHDHDHDHADGRAQDHGHSHGLLGGHHHQPAPDDMGRAFAIGVALNSAFVVAEVIAGLWSGSLALLADAGHNLSDVLSLVLAWGAAILARRAPTARRTYGLRKATILASLANAVLLLVAVGVIASEAVHRFNNPAPVATAFVMWTAGIGVVINTATALLFLRGRHTDLNVRGAFLHMSADAAISLAVVVGAGLMALTGFLWIDPALSIGIGVIIVLGTWGLLRDSVDLALDAVPKGIDVDKVRAWLSGLPGVEEVHDLHVWVITSGSPALSAHIIVAPGLDCHRLRLDLEAMLRERYDLTHTTLQVDHAEPRLYRIRRD